MNYADYYNGGGGGQYQPPQTPYGQHPYQQGDFGQGGMNSRRYSSYGMPSGFGMHSQGGYDQWRPQWQEGIAPQPGYQIPGMQRQRYKKRGQKGNFKYQAPQGGMIGHGMNPYAGGSRP